MKTHKIPRFVRPVVIALISVLLIVAAALTGCKLSSLSNSKPPQTTDQAKEAEGNQEVKNETDDPVPKPEPVKKSYNVLTGLETTSDLADLRPVAISISNAAYSLPQYGIGNADILVEVPLEDGSTRLALITTNYRKMTTIGSVASTRSYLMEICNAFHAVQCFNGSDGTVNEEILANYDILDYDSQNLAGMYYYDDTRFDETDLMTNGILVDAGIRKAGYADRDATDYLPFVFVEDGATARAGKTGATRASIRYSDNLSVTFAYDSATRQYVRYEYGEQQIDAATNTSVAFDNLFILCASSVTYETEDNKSLNLVMKDGGSGYYMSNGTVTNFLWKYAEDGTLDFYDMDGNQLAVNRGTSYIGFVTAGAKDTISIR